MKTNLPDASKLDKLMLQHPLCLASNGGEFTRKSRLDIEIKYQLTSPGKSFSVRPVVIL
jgi:hypothetical protein